jgi:hypothetical protein
MVKHIVFWRLKPDLPTAEREAALQRMKQGFEALAGKVPGLLRIEVGIDYSHGAEASDIALYSEFASREALAGYDTHVEHLALVPMVKAVRGEKRVVNYDV